jgi:hypothetical protein
VRSKAFKAVCDKLGFVYFGAVDQKNDDHDIVRGLTTSTTHKDRHFAVGSYDGYDISLVDRRDKDHQWCILQVSLHTEKSLPHVFMMPRHREAGFSERITGARSLMPTTNFIGLNLEPEFYTRYELFSLPRYGQELNEIMTSAFLKAVSAHFWPHALEIREGNLYVYITEHRLDETVVLSALQSALWLASLLDD